MPPSKVIDSGSITKNIGVARGVVRKDWESSSSNPVCRLYKDSFQPLYPLSPKAKLNKTSFYFADKKEIFPEKWVLSIAIH